MKPTLIKYAKRYDVIFSLGGMIVGSLIVQAQGWPVWALIGVVVVREVCGMMAMLAKEKMP